ncbi:hypothetical protein Patl1_19849 [Pistacia atlantica]|uniref:Uncharacterized protein n=1 Tax=Pistacia atlantica TaxID=434234 RepID=A0ACC1BKG1_9ROSI|nr:hypothetical protein Patl1_19849 [Pistacia atlantica]
MRCLSCGHARTLFRNKETFVHNCKFHRCLLFSLTFERSMYGICPDKEIIQ